MIGTEEDNNKIMIMNVSSMICDKNKSLEFQFFSEECIKLCSSENRHIGVKI